MSLPELTRSSFQNGITSAQWLDLCELCISKEDSNTTLDQVGNILSNSVIALFRSYPGHTVLQDYLTYAIEKGMISVPVYITTFLQATRSPELHDVATLDMLCRIALTTHYSSGMPPIGSLVLYSESPIVILETAQDALALLRTAHSLHTSRSHNLVSSASELVILLLSCVTDMSQVSTARAMVHFADATDILQTLRLSPDVRQVLETFVMSLGLLIGDDAKAAREAQMMHNFQLTLGKSDIMNPSSDGDTVSCGLILHHLLFSRASTFGAGSGPGAVAYLLGILRWSSWKPTIFYTQLLLSAFTCVSQCSSAKGDTSAFFLWKAFVIGRLPRLLVIFETALEAEGTTEADWRAAMRSALTSLLQHSELITQCDHIASQFMVSQNNSESTQEDLETPRSFTREFIQHLLASALIDHTFAVAVDPTISNDNPPRLRLEAQEAGIDLESYLDFKMTAEASIDDTQAFLERVYRDPGSHATFAEIIRKRFVSLTSGSDVEIPSHLSKLLYSHDTALDIVSLHVNISEIISSALKFLSDYDCETVGDPQTAVSHLGDIVLFVQSALARFELTRESLGLGENIFPTDILRSPAIVYRAEDLNSESAVAFNSWFKALFDKSSEGIEDSILRSTKPRILLLISATLFSQAISARADNKMDLDVLKNGVSYFTGPLLNWTLVGVLKALLREILQKGASVPIHPDPVAIHLEVLQTLLLSPSCPRPVLRLCSPSILRLLSARKAHGSAETTRFDTISVRQVALQALGIKQADHESLSTYPPGVWMDQSVTAIRTVLQFAQAGKAPSIELDRCLTVTPPPKFIQLLWSELSIAASLGQMEDCRRIATFVMVIMPRSPSIPRLLPIFLHVTLPSLIAAIDRQPPTEQTMSTELMVAIISSVLTAALHFELAVRTLCADKPNLGRSSMTMARRLAGDLRARKHSPTSKAIAQRLTSSHAFVTNFPVFMASEI